MRKYPRIEIDQLSYDGLQIEAVLQHKTPREIATKAILGYISQKALSAIDQTTDRPEKTILPENKIGTITKDMQTKEPMDQKTNGPEENIEDKDKIGTIVKDIKTERPDKPKDQKTIRPKGSKKTPEVLDLIKESWGRTPRPALRDIAEEVHKSTGIKIAHTTIKNYAKEMGL